MTGATSRIGMRATIAAKPSRPGDGRASRLALRHTRHTVTTLTWYAVTLHGLEPVHSAHVPRQRGIATTHARDRGGRPGGRWRAGRSRRGAGGRRRRPDGRPDRGVRLARWAAHVAGGAARRASLDRA